MKRSIGKKGRQRDNKEHIIMTTKLKEQTEFDTCGIGLYNSFFYCILYY